MISRRGFLGSTLGLTAGIVPGTRSAESTDGYSIRKSSWPEQAEYEQILAGYPHLEYLGIPRSWDAVRTGFHPFSPERTVIFPNDWLTHDAWSLKDTVERVRQYVEERKKKWKHSEKPSPSGLRMPAEKLHLLVKIVDLMTAYYMMPGVLEDWACALVCREELGSTCMMNGVGLAHQFQCFRKDSSHVPTKNALVDWWAFLIPEGADYENWCDEQPTYAVIGHVFDRHRIGFDNGVYWAAGSVVMRRVSEQGGWQELAAMDRVEASRFLNVELARGLKEELEKERRHSNEKLG